MSASDDEITPVQVETLLREDENVGGETGRDALLREYEIDHLLKEKQRLMEEIITNEATGGAKGRKPERMELLPWGVLRQYVAPLYAFGARKYAADNWRKGYDWSLSAGAMQRHFALWWEGEDYDAETECHHLASVVFHALALMFFSETHPELDDRPEHGLERAPSKLESELLGKGM